MNIVEGNTLPCGYVMGVHGALASGIPGLKSETWGTLRVFPLALVGKGNSHTGLSPYPSSTDALLFLELLASELRIACVHQRGVNDRAQNCCGASQSCNRAGWICRKNVPQGLKPDVFSIMYGPTKVVP
jgi:hypothetical protein